MVLEFSGVNIMFGSPKCPRFWYINDEEKERIEDFYKEHLHKELWGDNNAIGSVPYHIEIKPNSIAYSVIVVCDVCAAKRKTRKNKAWIRDVTTYSDW